MMYRLLDGCFAIVLVTLLWQSPSDADDDAGREEAASVVSGFFANMESIESLDVLWQCDSQWVADNGYIEETVTKGRLLVDPAKNRCFSVMERSLTKFAGSQNGAVENRSVSLNAVVFDGVQTWMRDFPEQPKPMSPKEISEVLYLNNSVLVHAVGTLPFPVYYFQERGLRGHFESLRRGADGKLKAIAGSGDTQGVTWETTGGKIFNTQWKTLFDVTKLIPVRMVQSAVFIADERVLRKVIENYQFIEKEGLYLPSEITGEKGLSKRIGESKELFPGTEVYDVRFRWFSVNELLDDKYFSVQLLKDMKQISELVASKLLEDQNVEN